jgi:hypothetical protein
MTRGKPVAVLFEDISSRVESMYLMSSATISFIVFKQDEQQWDISWGQKMGGGLVGRLLCQETLDC